MTRFILLLAVFSASCAYETPGRITVKKNSNENKKIVVFDSREYALTREPNYEVEQDFQNAVSSAFEKAFPDGDSDARRSFSYAITPKGAVYPFSKVEVGCLVREDLRGKYAREICSRFYDYLDKSYSDIKEELK